MSFNDPISDMFVRIKNAQLVNHAEVEMPSSKHKKAIAELLYKEGYIGSYHEVSEGVKIKLIIKLKYHQDKPVIRQIKRVSKPGLRQYRPANELSPVLGGLGLGIISTSRGLMSLRDARERSLGGEIIGEVS